MKNKKLLPEIKLNRDDSDIKNFKYLDEDTLVGKRNKLGGIPENLNIDEYSKCPHCGMEMTFYGQLDSISDEFMIMDCAVILVFLCFDCNEVKSFIQPTLTA